jgi:hypothetical protein
MKLSVIGVPFVTLSFVACMSQESDKNLATNDSEESTVAAEQALNSTRHQQTTKVGVGPWVSNATTLNALVSVSTIGDSDSSTNMKSETHFDNCYWEEGRAWVIAKRSAAVSRALTWYQSQTAANQAAVFEQLGYALHATEDFYAHSNWAETHDPGTIAPFDEIPTRPANWYSGTYNNTDDTGANAGYLHCPAAMRFSHSQMNKDGVGGLIGDEAFIDAAAAASDQIRRFIAAVREASPEKANSILSGLGFVTTNPATSLSRSDFTRTVAPAAGLWGQAGASLFCSTGTYVAAFRQRVEAAQGAGDDTALNAVELYCKSKTGYWTERLNTWDGAWGDWGEWVTCPTGYVNGAALKIEPGQGAGDDTSANGARFTCTNGSTISASNDGAWGSYVSSDTCPSGEAVCGAQTIVEPPISAGDDTALNGLLLHCCRL